MMTLCYRGFWIGIICLITADVLLACDKDDAEKGAKECVEALKETSDENQLKLATDPTKTACCMTFHLTDCMQYAFKEAECLTTNKEISKEFEDEMKEAQSVFNTILQQASKIACKDIDMKTCSYMADDFDEAKEEIRKINGVSANAPSAFLAFLLFALVLIKGNF